AGTSSSEMGGAGVMTGFSFIKGGMISSGMGLNSRGVSEIVAVAGESDLPTTSGLSATGLPATASGEMHLSSGLIISPICSGVAAGLTILSKKLILLNLKTAAN